VAIVPGIAFGLDDYARISYTLEDEKLEEGLERIEKFLQAL
jgi:aspartate aminotransferase